MLKRTIRFRARCRLLLSAATLLLHLLPLSAQPAPYYNAPMRIPLSLSANFAEVRSNHLHSGVDFRTDGKEGEPVYAVAQGYIQRVVVRPDGYGKALYLRHPNGTYSVYAHLREFVPKVAKWAKNQQYRQQAFYLDAELDSLAFPVKQGELIGYSGNSGRSFGPHLHFEIRDRYQRPLNIIQNGTYKIADKTPPVAYQLVAYRFDTIRQAALPIEHSAYSIRAEKGGELRLTKDTISVPTPCYFGLNLRDQMDGSQSIYGVSRCELRLNDAPIFAYSMEKFSFDETRYANAMVDFSRTASKFIRLYVAPGNALSVYRDVKNQGVISLKKNEVGKVSITMTDDAGNTSRLSFWVKGADKTATKKLQLTKHRRLALYNRSNTLEVNGFKAVLPAGALYESSIVEVQTLGPAYGSVSPVFWVKQPLTPPHRAVSVSLKADVPENLRSKAAIVCMSKNGGKEALTTTCQPPYFTANTSSWGYFFVAIDTVAPQVTPVNFTPNARLSAHQTHITLKVKDNLKLKSYAGYVDGAWALFDYDEKNDLMTYEIDSTRVKTDAQHLLVFIATDGVGNRTELSCRLFF